MKILITGAKGMLAQAVRERFLRDAEGAENELVLTDVAPGEIEVSRGETVEKLATIGLDITDLKAVSRVISEVRPEVIINCAAYTNVDAAELNAELAEKINADGPANLAKMAKEAGAVLVHISTDYVFGGIKPVTEEYSEDDPKEPQSVYGITKLHGEEKIAENTDRFYIFRTAWLYGQGKNFVRTMLSVAEGRDEVTVVNDQHGSPTYAEDLADIIYQAVYKNIPFGIYNATNLGFTTWAEFTEEIYRQAGVNCKVVGVSSEEYEQQAMARAAEKGEEYKVAPRPKNSQMSKQKLADAGIAIRHWSPALAEYLRREGKLIK